VLNLWLEPRKVARHGLPYDLGIDIEVAMHEHVAHPNDLRPWDVGCERLQLWRETPGGFTNDLQVPEKPALQQFVALQGGLAAAQVPLDRGNGFQNYRADAPSGLSHRNRFAQDALADSRLQSALGQHIDRPTEQGLQFELEAA
jgi:hypothetical protein